MYTHMMLGLGVRGVREQKLIHWALEKTQVPFYKVEDRFNPTTPFTLIIVVVYYNYDTLQ